VLRLAEMQRRLIDHLVGQREQSVGDFDAEHPSGYSGSVGAVGVRGGAKARFARQLIGLLTIELAWLCA